MIRVKKFKIKFIYSFRFMSSSLASLLDNLSDEIYNDKCVNCKSHLDYIPANICWSWRRLQHVFSETVLRLPRRLGQRKIVTLKMSSRRLEPMSWRRFEDMSWWRLENIMETKKILGISVSNKSIFHKSIFYNSKANPKCTD